LAGDCVAKKAKPLADVARGLPVVRGRKKPNTKPKLIKNGNSKNAEKKTQKQHKNKPTLLGDQKK